MKRRTMKAAGGAWASRAGWMAASVAVACTGAEGPEDADFASLSEEAKAAPAGTIVLGTTKTTIAASSGKIVVNNVAVKRNALIAGSVDTADALVTDVSRITLSASALDTVQDLTIDLSGGALP
ncbi:MAG: hypothetical protein RL199_1114, partial [Pseudomonadota bacterium]